MSNTEFNSAALHAITRNAVEDSRDIAQTLSRTANNDLCEWLLHEEPNSEPEQRARSRYEQSERMASKALNVYRLMIRRV
jgi:hypothetical protein